MRRCGFLLLLLSTVASAALAAGTTKPTLAVMIVVDQYSADLFSEYRPLYTKGMATLARGAVFPHGYQSHAATETCPGHSTILTGARPGRTGIIANEWQDPARPHKDGSGYSWYCVEGTDEHGGRIVTPAALQVP